MVKIVSEIYGRNSEIVSLVLDTMAELCKTASSILLDLKSIEEKIADHKFQLLFKKLEVCTVRWTVYCWAPSNRISTNFGNIFVSSKKIYEIFKRNFRKLFKFLLKM